MSDGSTSEFPKMAVGTWWHLRRRFRKAVPRKVSREYLNSALGSTEDSAPKSTLPDLQRMSLVDDGGAPTDLATRWGDDAQYREVCKVIRERVYPSQLRDLGANRESATSWFATNTRVDKGTAGRMAAFYLMLVEADLRKLSPPDK